MYTILYMYFIIMQIIALKNMIPIFERKWAHKT